MKKNFSFTPEFGLFILLIFVAGWILVGITYWLLIKSGGMNVTSWWRSTQKNFDVGGVANSLHLVGMAWDVVPVNASNVAKLRGLGLKVINEGDHLHAQII